MNIHETSQICPQGSTQYFYLKEHLKSFQMIYNKHYLHRNFGQKTKQKKQVLQMNLNPLQACDYSITLLGFK